MSPEERKFRQKKPDGTIDIISEQVFNDLRARRRPIEQGVQTAQTESAELQRKLTSLEGLRNTRKEKLDRQAALNIEMNGFPFRIEAQAGADALTAEIKRVNPRWLPAQIKEEYDKYKALYDPVYAESVRVNTELSDIATRIPPLEANEADDIRELAARTRSIADNQAELARMNEPIAPAPNYEERALYREFIAGSREPGNKSEDRYTDLVNGALTAIYTPATRVEALKSIADLRRVLSGDPASEKDRQIARGMLKDTVLINGLAQALGVTAEGWQLWGLKSVETTKNTTTGEVDPKTGIVDYKYGAQPVSHERWSEIVKIAEEHLLPRMRALTPNQTAEIIRTIYH